MSENKTPNKTEDSNANSVGFSELLAMYGEQMGSCLNKAEELDKMIRELPQTADNVDTHKRLSIKAGVWRSVAHDMKNTLKIHLG